MGPFVPKEIKVPLKCSLQIQLKLHYSEAGDPQSKKWLFFPSAWGGSHPS